MLEKNYTQENIEIKALINQIHEADKERGEEALLYIFDFVFGAIEDDKFELINNLMLDNEVLTLKPFYQIGILNISKQCREKVPYFNEYLEKVKRIAEPEMDKTDFELTFKKFKKKIKSQYKKIKMDTKE